MAGRLTSVPGDPAAALDAELPPLVAPGDSAPREPKGDRPKRGRPTKAAAAAKAAAAPREPAKAGPGRPSGSAVLAKRTAKTIETIGYMVQLVQPVDAAIIIAGAPRLGAALADAAETNPALKRFLEGLGKGSGWSEVAMAAGAIVLPILAVHGVLPPLFLSDMVQEPSAPEGTGPQPPAAA